MDEVAFFPVEIQQASWHTAEEAIAAIREAVFIDEQNVSREIEFDRRDPDCLHWLAYASQNEAVGTARLLPSGQIGRVAVLKPFRNNGIGSTMIRKIIQYALHEGLPRIFLHAQIPAQPFYKELGFSAYDDVFNDEANIPHQAMELNLNKFRHPASERQLPEIKSEEKVRQPLDGATAFSSAAIQLVKGTQKKLAIFSDKLEPAYLADKTFITSVSHLILNHPHAEIRILLRNTDVLRGNSHPLLLLKGRLSSAISIRKLHPESSCEHNDFLLGDQRRILYQQEERRPVGYMHIHAPLEGRELSSDFNSLWEHGIADPQLRRLFV